MRSIPLPTDTYAEVFALCLDATEDANLHVRLTAARTALAATNGGYQSHAMGATLHLIPRVLSVGSVSKDELKGLYETHLSRTRGAARPVYDRIRNAVPNNRCPLCGVGSVAHCDHHLPKSRYPDLAILPMNLVPACHFCNDKKKSKFPENAGQQTFHPYFDQHLLQDAWVHATLNPGPPPVLVFDTRPPSIWTEQDKSRVARHFDVCGLGVTFTTNANDELPIIRDRLILQANHGGVAAVQQFLDQERDLHSQRLNSWQHATYRELASNTWFVNGGYLTIP